LTAGSLRVASATLATLIEDCFAAVGLSSADASAMAGVLIDANLRGVESHGFQRVPTYMGRVSAGLAGGGDAIAVRAQAGPMRRIDAADALGPIGATRATDAAIELAREHGIGLVALGNSGHFGAAGYYARRVAGEKLIALVTTNGPGTMAPHGATEPFVGTSALAIAVPLGRHEPFCLDMSASVVARGKVMRAKAQGTQLEPGIAIDADGRPTLDPAAALAGSVLPLGGPKGSGLALAIGLLSGILAGADFDDQVAPMHGDSGRRQNVGHVFVTIDPWRLADRDETTERLDQLVERLRGLRTAEGFDRVLYAGERGAEMARERRANGIPVRPAELEGAAAACEDAGAPELAARLRALAL